jgi:hypothetical protein
MGIHIFPHEDSAFEVCPLALFKFDSNKGQMSPKPIPHVACRSTHLVATKIILGLSHATITHLATQEE